MTFHMCRQYIYFHFSQKVKGVVVGGNQTYIFSHKKGRMGKSERAKQRENSTRPPIPFLDTSMSVGIVSSIKMKICQQENKKQPPTFSITTRLQTGMKARNKWLPNFGSGRIGRTLLIRQECWQIKNLKNYG